jgi:hypothetical protein
MNSFISKRHLIIVVVYFLISSSLYTFSWLLSILTIDGSAPLWDILIAIGKSFGYPIIYLISPFIYSNTSREIIILISIISLIINSFIFAVVIELILKWIKKHKVNGVSHSK